MTSSTEHDPSNHFKKLFVYAVCIFSMIALPVMLYFKHVFFGHKHSVMIEKRHPDILHLQGMFTISFFAFVYPFMILDFIELDEFASMQTLVSVSNRLLYPLLGPTPLVYCIALRFWHIYYDLKYNSSQKNSEWKYHLDPYLVQNNFWLHHKQTIGSPPWTRALLIKFLIITSICTVIPYQIGLIVGQPTYLFIGHACQLLFAATPVTIMLVIYKNVPKYSDNFFVKKELEVITVGLFASMPFSFGAVLYGVISHSSPGLPIALCVTLFAIVIFVGSWYSFFHIPYKVRREEQEIMLAKLCERQNSKEMSVYTSTGSDDRTKVGKSNAMQMGGIVRRLSHLEAGRGSSFNLHVVLSNEKTFKLFMQHLAKEFSTECLLCFAEIVQYKFAFKQRIDIVDDAHLTVEPGFTAKCPLSQVVPVSAIIRKGFEVNLRKYSAKDDVTDLMIEAKNVCFALYNKYVVAGCELEVNISYSMRARLSGLMTSRRFWYSFKISIDDLFTIFDDVAEQMFRLMDGAFTRFRQVQTWNVVREILKDQHNIFRKQRKHANQLRPIPDIETAEPDDDEVSK
eukprot:454514_1